MVLNHLLRKSFVSNQLVLKILIAMTLITSTQAVHAEIIFEAFYKVYLSDVAVGYSVERFEFDKKKSEFIATSYTKLKGADKDTTESTKAYADSKLVPKAYEYTFASNDPKTQEKSYKNIKATIKNQVLKAKVLEGKKEYEITKSLQKGTYLAIFLPFALLNSKDGLQVDKHYSYIAIAEETGEPHPGEAYVKGKEDYEGIAAFKILNKYDKDSFVSLMTASGDVLEVRIPSSQVKLKMVKSQEEAVDQFQFSSSNMALLFGTVPVGKDNALYKKQIAPNAKSLQQVLGEDEKSAGSVNTPPSAKKKQVFDQAGESPAKAGETQKQSGVKGGQNIMIKSRLPPPKELPPAEPKKESN
jgi:hypothetical protein